MKGQFWKQTKFLIYAQTSLSCSICLSQCLQLSNAPIFWLPWICITQNIQGNPGLWLAVFFKALDKLMIVCALYDFFYDSEFIDCRGNARWVYFYEGFFIFKNYRILKIIRTVLNVQRCIFWWFEWDSPSSVFKEGILFTLNNPLSPPTPPPCSPWAIPWSGVNSILMSTEFDNVVCLFSLGINNYSYSNYK